MLVLSGSTVVFGRGRELMKWDSLGNIRRLPCHNTRGVESLISEWDTKLEQPLSVGHYVTNTVTLARLV